MSHFLYAAQTDRKKRVGICLWFHRLPKELQKRINKMIRPFEFIWIVSVCELRDNDEVLLEVECSSLFDLLWEMVFKPKHHRAIIYHFVEKENPEWICRGDTEED